MTHAIPEMTKTASSISKDSIAIFIHESVRLLDKSVLSTVPFSEKADVRSAAIENLIRSTAKSFGIDAISAAHHLYPVETVKVLRAIAKEQFKARTLGNPAVDGTYSAPLSTALRSRFQHYDIQDEPGVGEFSTGLTQGNVTSAGQSVSKSWASTAADVVINDKLSGLLGDDISKIAPQLQETVTPAQVSEQLIKELGADGVKMAVSMGLPVAEEVAKEHGIDLLNLKLSAIDYNDYKGVPGSGTGDKNFGEARLGDIQGFPNQ